MAAEVKEGGAYSQTLNLPKTDFPMKGDLPKREPERLAFWEKLGLYERLRRHQAKRAQTFLLHDGPPYANGHIHIGHALNKVLKDLTVKSRSLLGAQTPYRPGWDCHGLPIETALLKEKRMSKRGISDIPAFRREAEDFVRRFIALQRDEFKRLGVFGDWDRPYLTMARDYESRVLRAFRLLLKDGFIYRGLKPVYWCVTCESALAEAEIEYKEKESPSIYVAFPIKNSSRKELVGAEVLVWTTTPWTLPANRAAAFNPAMTYQLIDVETPLGTRRLLFAPQRLDPVVKAIGSNGKCTQNVSTEISGKAIVDSGLTYQRPFGGEGIAVAADYVTAEDGTGVVHTAPGHGADDFATGRKYGLEIANPVDSSGRFTAEAGALAGKQIFAEGNPAVIADLKARQWLLSEQKIRHSYPHCWRCKNPVIFRATEQWFLSVDKGGFRQKLLEIVGRLRWVPPEGQQRISAMVSGRPDWCISRQRVWGTPIPILYCAGCQAPVTDDAALKAIEGEVARSGDGFWFSDWGKTVTAKSWPFLPPRLACPKCGQSEFRREQDILDVWVDSGASWLAVLEDDGQAPCDLYLEGSDQHRGWFQSSLVIGAGLKGEAPFKSVLTHGFVLDEKGHAMHKSAGNVVAPQEVIGKLGADVLRLWVALSDYSDDVRISDKLLSGPSESYRKVRNTLRYLLSNTSDFSPADQVAFESLPELERLLLHRLALLQEQTLADYGAFRYRSAALRLVDFCNLDLSAFYCDVLKDRMYTFPAGAPARRAAQTAMKECLDRLLMLAAPILSFTAEEAWQFRPASWGGAESVFLADLPAVAQGWRDPQLGARWDALLALREAVQKQLEIERAAKRIGSSLQAKVIARGAVREELSRRPAEFWQELFVVSQVELAAGSGPEIEVKPSDGRKCARCWRYQPDVGASAERPDVCGRCVRHLAGRP